ncbi:MAG: hypothetical protein HND57_03885 [Planctomycetes bacterium]|nr:hypothetical protein [Planctomycetota bacterium]
MSKTHWFGCLVSVWLVPTLLAQSNGIQINTDADGYNILNDAANEPSFAISPIDPDVIVVGWRQFNTISSDVRYAGCAIPMTAGVPGRTARRLSSPRGPAAVPTSPIR